MRKAVLIRLVLPGLFALAAFSAAADSGADPAALAEAISTARLDPERAVEIKKMRLRIGMAIFQVDRGIFFPATPIGDRVVEMVFKGRARLILDPPDDVEAGQLELYTGSPSLKEEISEAVLVIAVDAAVDAIYSRPPSAGVDPASRSRAEEIFRRWQERPERQLLGVETAILGDALDDPFYANYFAGWFRSQELGEFFYLLEPDAAEQITLGQFVPFAATTRETHPDWLDREMVVCKSEWAQRKGRLIGLSMKDLGHWDTWLSASLAGEDGKPTRGTRAFEPQRYVLDLTLAEPNLEIRGRARLHLRAVTSVGRVVKLDIHPDFAVRRARFEGGQELYFHQSQGDVLVVLPQAPEQEETVAIAIEYSGHLLDKVRSKTWVLRSPTHWYPHAGTSDLATYDVTFHWPKQLDLIAGGQRVDGGVEDGGRRFERRRVDHPSSGFTFEVGKFRTLTGTAGHVSITVALDSPAQSVVDEEGHQKLLAAVTDSVVYFEQIFGPYPLDELVVATAARECSQSYLGFVTVPSLNISEDGLMGLIKVMVGREQDPRAAAAHEIAHQWWGHMVAWQSYRDEWLSEAIANYAARLYSHNGFQGELPVLIMTTSRWHRTLTRHTMDGRPIESLGPLVLGERLDSSRSGEAYHAIVYQKGALVLDMLRRFFGKEPFLNLLRRLFEAASFQPISTPHFIDLLARLSGRNLDGFANHFIYGTGLPEIFYTCEFEEEAGKWLVEGVARQKLPHRYDYRVVERHDGTLDVTRDRREQIELADWVLVVPVEIAVYDPEGKVREKSGLDPLVVGNTMVMASVRLQGESSDIRFQLDHEPKDLWLDRREGFFGRFFNEQHHPKRVLYHQGLDLAAAGRLDEAETIYRKALAAQTSAVPAYAVPNILFENPIAETIELDVRINLELTRLYLDQDRITDARAAFDAVPKNLPDSIRYAIGGQINTLEVRLAIRAGEYELAYKLLHQEMGDRGKRSSAESLLLLAIAARETGHAEEFRAAGKAASELGADVSLLNL